MNQSSLIIIKEKAFENVIRQIGSYFFQGEMN